MLLKERGVRNIKDLTKIDRYNLIINNKLKASGLKDNKKRSFKPENVNKYGEVSRYIAYSASSDKIYCLSCSMFEKTSVQHKPVKWIDGFNN